MQGTQFRIGRGADNDIVLDDPLASRAHARLIRESQAVWERASPAYVWLLEDWNTSKGTLVNGEVLRTGRCLADGDQIQIGGSILVFRSRESATLLVTRAASSGMS